MVLAGEAIAEAARSDVAANRIIVGRIVMTLRAGAFLIRPERQVFKDAVAQFFSHVNLRYLAHIHAAHNN